MSQELTLENLHQTAQATLTKHTMQDTLLNSLTDDQIISLEDIMSAMIEARIGENTNASITAVNTGEYSYDITLNLSAQTIGTLLNPPLTRSHLTK